MSTDPSLAKSAPATRAASRAPAAAVAVAAAAAAGGAGAGAGAGAGGGRAAAAPARGARTAAAATAAQTEARPLRRQAQAADSEQEQGSEQDETDGEVGGQEGGRERGQQPRQEEEQRPGHTEGPAQGAGGEREVPAEEEQWRQEEEQLRRRLRQLEGRRRGEQRGGAGAAAQAAAQEKARQAEAQEKAPQRQGDSSAREEAERRAARWQKKWERAEWKLQQARVREAVGGDPTPPPSPPPSSSDSERDDDDDDDDGRGDAGPAAARARRPRAGEARQAPRRRDEGVTRRQAQAPVRFTGDEQPPVDVEMWLGQVRLYLRVTAEEADTDARRRDHALLLLDGSARNWWLRKPEEEQDAVGSFEELRDAMLARFRPIAAKDTAFARAVRVRQREGQAVQQYFDGLTEALAPLSEQECPQYVRVGMFLNGLRPAVLSRVLEIPGVREGPLSTVANLAIAKESAMAAAGSYAYGQRDGGGAGAGQRQVGLRAIGAGAAGADDTALEEQPQRSAAEAATAAEKLLRDGLEQLKATLGAMQSRWGSGGVGDAQWRPSRPGGPRLSDAEREECFRKGLCFFCREPGHNSRGCPKRNARTGAQTPKLQQGN